MRLVNTGEVAVILPTGYSPSGSLSLHATKQERQFTAGFSVERTQDGMIIKQPIAGVAPVHLNPSEAVDLKPFEFVILWRDEMPLELNVDYQVSDEFGRIYGVWSGKLEAQTVTLWPSPKQEGEAQKDDITKNGG